MASTAALPQTAPLRRPALRNRHFVYLLEGGKIQPWPEVDQVRFERFDPFRISMSIRRLRILGMATRLPKLNLDIVSIDRFFTVVSGDVALAFRGEEDGPTEMGIYVRPEAPKSAAVTKGAAIVRAIRDEIEGRRPDIALLAD